MSLHSAISYNPISATCTQGGSCLSQVAGYIDSNPAEQLFGCRAMFGLPVITTITIPSDPILSTTVDTSTYTDIIISTSTVYSTLEETLTAYDTISVTATAYTTTLVNTLTTTLPAPTVVKRDSKKRRGCQPNPSTSSTVSPSTSSSTESSTTSSTTTSTTSSSPLFPLATNCPSREEYSSACACLEPAAVTVYAPAITSIIHETESATVESTTETVITLAVTAVIVQPVTTTLTSTLTTLTSSTTTATETSTPSPVVLQTFSIVLNDGPNAGRPAIIAGTAPAYTLQLASAGSTSQIGLAGPNTTPFVSGNSGYKMYIRMSTSNYGIVFFTTPTYVASSAYAWASVTCSLNPTTHAMSCAAPGGVTRFLQCGSSFYMANPTTTPGGCIEVHLRAVP